MLIGSNQVSRCLLLPVLPNTVPNLRCTRSPAAVSNQYSKVEQQDLRMTETLLDHPRRLRCNQTSARHQAFTRTRRIPLRRAEQGHQETKPIVIPFPFPALRVLQPM